jgi:tetratricopeptide (TPR) repeat protein
MVNIELARKMREVQAEVQKLDTGSALSILTERIKVETDPPFAIEMKITKAKLLKSLGSWQEAVDLLDECAKSPEADESAAYFAAEILVEEDRIPEAVEFLETAERQIAGNGSMYYKDCIFLLHAFCEVRRSRLDRAKQLLDEVTVEEAALIWLRTTSVISVVSVRDLLAGDN